MKKILLLAAFMLSMVPVMSAELLTNEVASSYSKVIDGWTYITNAKEFMKLVSECQDPNVGEKKIRLACDIEYPEKAYSEISAYYIKYFNGVFDGMGCSIKFYMHTVSRNDIDVAFIQDLTGSNSEVCNLRFDNCSVVSYSTGRNMALVVGKVTATRSSFHDIYVEGGTIQGGNTGGNSIGAMGGLICKINKNTTIDHCAFYNTNIYWEGHEDSYPVGIFCDGCINDNDNYGCTVSNCYLASTPKLGHTMTKFSCRAELTNNEIAHNVAKYPNCFYTEDCGIDLNSNDFKNVTSITLSSLKSGSIGSGWKYGEDVVPQPEGLYYWVPNKTYNLTVGTYGSSQNLQGSVTPMDYGRFLNVTQLKLTGITSSGSGAYVINDNITTQVDNPITAIASDVFRNISMTTLKLPGLVTTIEGSAFRHGVTEGFISSSNGRWRYVGNCLYLNTDEISRLMTVVGNNEELTIDGRYCNSILDEALKGQTSLKNLYVNTWFPTGSEGPFNPIELLGNNIFNDCPSNMNVYIKDGTTTQAIIGEDIDHGYKDNKIMWTQFYSESEDKENRLFQYYPVTCNPAGLSTIILGYPFPLPEGCTAWVATGRSEGKLELERVKGNVVPALLPVLLSYKQTKGVLHFTPYEGANPPAATSYERSIFKGSVDPTGHKMNDSEKQTNFLTLSRSADEPDNWEKVGFYKFLPGKYHPSEDFLPSYVAWIGIQDASQAKLTMVFGGDYEIVDTHIRDTSAETIQNASAPAYNLSGQRVGSNYRGFIIKNGRKYIAK